MPKNLSKREIVLEIFGRTSIAQKDAVTAVQITIDVMQEALAAGRSIEFRNFGMLRVRKKRTWGFGPMPRGPDAASRIRLRKVVEFKPGKVLGKLLKVSEPTN